MILEKRRRGERSAFTLIELLVVIAIIAILLAMTGAAVMRVLVKGPEFTTKSEMDLFEQRLAGVQSQPGHEVIFLPSRLHLSKTNNYANNPLDNDTKAYLAQRFGRQACYGFQNPPPNGKFIDWNGDGQSDGDIFLEGEQCLVFHLGGIPTYGPGVTGTIGFLGFSTNETDPSAASAVGQSRQGPFFQFSPDRVRLYNSTTQQVIIPPYAPANIAGAYPVYLDPWKVPGSPQPYLFFSSTSPNGNGQYLKYGAAGDCSSFGVLPYMQSPTLFMYPTSFQIISAGRNGKFGAGGLWNPATGVLPANNPGVDDQANFSPRLLGIGS